MSLKEDVGGEQKIHISMDDDTENNQMTERDLIEKINSV